VKKFALLLIVILAISMSVTAADKPIRVEMKMGIPNLLGGSVEYMLPDLGIPAINNALAPYIDVSVFNLALDETVSFGFSYFGLGAKYYFDQLVTDLGLPSMADGTYAALGFGRMGFTFTDDAWLGDYDSSIGTWIEGSAEGSIGVSMLQFSIGKRWMLGPLTGTLELGKTFGSMDDTFEVEVNYNNGTSETDVEDTSDIPLGVGGLAALTIGFAF